jgi:alpha-D-xyloside xylohydrolase
MRVYNGTYEINKGIEFHKPECFYDYELSEKEVKVYALIHEDLNADKIHGKIIQYIISSPFPNVFRIRIRHFQPQKTLKFQTYGNKQSLNITDNEDFILMRTGLLGLQFEKKRWTYAFKTDRLLTISGNDSSGFIYDAKKSHYITEKLSLRVGGLVYGTGERFSPFIKNGQHIRIWNTDSATESDLAYKNIPFYLTSSGYGVFINSTSPVDFEICTEHNSAVRFSVPHKELDYYLFYGPSPKEIINLYTALTGRPPLIPKWSLGLWMTTSFTTDYNKDVVYKNIEGMFQRNIPLSVFHFDCFWMKERRWCNFQWNRDIFPDPEGMLKQLKQKGLKICLWINPYISELSELFEEGVKNDFFLKDKNGDVYQLDWWQPGMAIVDFTTPGACEWYKDKLRPLLEMGVDTFKTDFGESTPPDAVYYSGECGLEMHNYYTYLYNKTVFELLTDYFGKGNAVVFARSATAGSNQFPVHWSGDSRANYLSMYGQLRGGLSFGICGGAFWSHDIGGFYGKPSPDVYKRWIAFGLLSSHSRLHGNDSFRVPWNFDEESSDVLRYFTELRHKLIPYIFSLCYEASLCGVPVIRPMFLEFPDDPGCGYLDRQYMLGNSLLVAPVFNKDGNVDFYLPEGEWTNFWTHSVVSGGKWLREKHNFFSLPLYVRENSLLPTGPVNQAPFRNSLEDLTVTIYLLKEKAVLVLYEGEEIVITAQREKDAIKIDLSKVIPGIKFQLSGIDKSWQCNKSNILIKLDNIYQKE